jgi:hypothetical protein
VHQAGCPGGDRDADADERAEGCWEEAGIRDERRG